MSWSLYNVYINSSHWIIPTIPKDPKRINTHQGTAANQGKEKNSQIINHGKNKTLRQRHFGIEDNTLILCFWKKQYDFFYMCATEDTSRIF